MQMLEQRADRLELVKDNSVDVVISLQSADRMTMNGIEWRESIREGIRVLKPGSGRLLFVEKGNIGFLEFLEEFEGTLLDEVQYDKVDLVLEPHIAGVAFKLEDAGLTEAEKVRKENRKEKDEYAELSFKKFERGKKRRRKKKNKEVEGKEEEVKK